MRISRLAKCFGFLVFALVLFPTDRLIAGTTASISGTVTDPSGAVIAGATVTATNLETAVVTTLTSRSACVTSGSGTRGRTRMFSTVTAGMASPLAGKCQHNFV